MPVRCLVIHALYDLNQIVELFLLRTYYVRLSNKHHQVTFAIINLQTQSNA